MALVCACVCFCSAYSLCPRCFPNSQKKVCARVFSFQVVIFFSSFLKVLAAQIFAAKSRPVIIMMVIFLIVPMNLVLMHYCKHISQAHYNNILLREKYPGSTCI